MRVILYETRIQRTVISILDVESIDQLIDENYEYDTEQIPTDENGIYRVALSSHHRYKAQKPCCWKTSDEGQPIELIVGNALFIKKGIKGKYLSLTDKDIVRITRRYRPYDHHVV